MILFYLLGCGSKLPAIKSYPTLFKINPPRTPSLSSKIQEDSVSSVFAFSIPEPKLDSNADHDYGQRITIHLFFRTRKKNTVF